MAFRMNYVGSSMELHHPIEYQNHIFDALMEAGAVPLKPFGIRAMDAMRLEILPHGRHRAVDRICGTGKRSRPVRASPWAASSAVRRSASGRSVACAHGDAEVHDTVDADALGGNPVMLRAAR